MKLLRLVAMLAIVVVCLRAVPLRAQGPVTLSIDDVKLDNPPQITLLVTVRDANGVPIPDLVATDFEMVEDGRISFPPGQVDTQVNPEATTSALLVVDVSGSMKGKPIDEAKRAATSFVERLGAQDRAGIIAFGDRVDLDVNKLEEGKELGFTIDKNALRNVIDLLDTKIGGDTPLYDAIYKGIGLTAREPAGKRAMIVMTDGRDERDNAKGTPVPNAGSLTAPDDPINEATRQAIPIFAIGLGAKPDAKYLSRLALRTGGQYQEAPNPEELTTLFQKVQDQLKQQYVLRYSTGLAEDSSYHSLMVRVRAPQGQAFDEVKFLLGSEPAPTAVVLVADPPTAIAQTTAVAPTPEPTPEGFFAKIQKNVEDTIDDNPELAAAIGGGALLLIILIIVLVVIVVRGRRRAEASAFPADLPEPEAPAAPVTGVSPRPGFAPPPPPDAATVGWDDSAAPAWPAAMPGAPAAPPAWPAAGQPATPWAGQPPQAAAPGGGFSPVTPPEEGTRVIQRAPRHLAMLVNRTKPDQKFDLRDTMNVGRAPDNQIVVDHPTVSRHHAWIKEDKGEFLVFDVGSGNGTFVNGQKVDAPRPLQQGDVVRFGEVEFAFTKVF